MKAPHDDPHPSKTEIHFEPMIHMLSSGHSCIYSTMLFTSYLARTYGHDYVLTLPLYWKATEITTHVQQKGSFYIMDIMLDIFHTCMSCYGSIGYIMAGSGIQSLLELIYGEHTVSHTISSKVFSHATGAHLITAGVLSALLIGTTHNINFNLNVKNENFVTY